MEIHCNVSNTWLLIVGDSIKLSNWVHCLRRKMQNFEIVKTFGRNWRRAPSIALAVFNTGKSLHAQNVLRLLPQSICLQTQPAGSSGVGYLLELELSDPSISEFPDMPHRVPSPDSGAVAGCHHLRVLCPFGFITFQLKKRVRGNSPYIQGVIFNLVLVRSCFFLREQEAQFGSRWLVQGQGGRACEMWKWRTWARKMGSRRGKGPGLSGFFWCLVICILRETAWKPSLGQFLAADWGVMKKVKVWGVTVRRLAAQIFWLGCHDSTHHWFQRKAFYRWKTMKVADNETMRMSSLCWKYWDKHNTRRVVVLWLS